MLGEPTWPMPILGQQRAAKEMANAVARSAERLDGAARFVAMLEDKTDNERIAPGGLAAVRAVAETCAGEFDDAWKEV